MVKIIIPKIDSFTKKRKKYSKEKYRDKRLFCQKLHKYQTVGAK